MTTEFNTDWDIDYYKTNYESDEHWGLRRAFIETHKDKFPESELVCLAQVFTNVEFLGCRYPDATMRKVALLSQEVAAEYRQKRESTLKRTFVGASDAAGAKAKGRNAATNAHNNTISNSSLKRSFQSNTETLSSSNFQSTSPANQQDSNAQPQPQPSNPNKCPQWKKRLGNVGFILFETLTGGQAQPSIHILQMSAAKQGAVCKVEFEATGGGKKQSTECVVYINNAKYGSAIVADNKKDAKTQACDWALENARQIHYSIKQKGGVKSINIDCDSETKVEPSPSTSAPAAEDNKISANNKGFKMMKLLGWSGGALGSKGSGIEEPISVQVKVDRKGLGLLPSEESNSNLNRQYFMKYLSAYKNDESAIHELVFSKDFTKEERKVLHEIVNRIGLKSKSKNLENGDRYLIVHKKINLVHLANDILNNGPYAEFYELIPPVNVQAEQTEEIPRKKKRRNKAI